MKFETYLDIMQNHGIREMVFTFLGNEFCVYEEFNADGCGCLTFSIIMPEHMEEFGRVYDFDSIKELVEAKVFDNRSLQEIWNDIEIISLDGASESEYDPEEFSFNFAKAVSDFGEIQWKYSLSVKKSFLYQLKYCVLSILIFPILFFTLFPILGILNWWNTVGFLACMIIAIGTSIIALLRTRNCFGYIVTDKKLFVFKGFTAETTYDNIKKIKLKKSIFNKNVGTIKVYVKKGLSIRFHILSIPEPTDVYNLILKNLNNNVN